MLSQTGFYATAYIEAYREAKAKAKIELKDEVIAEVRAEAEAKAEAKAKVQIEKVVRFRIRLSVMRGWKSGILIDTLTDVTDLPSAEVRELIAACEKVKTYCHSHVDIDNKKLKQLSGLSEPELKALLALLQK